MDKAIIHLSEEQLSRFGDGEASAADARHLEGCPHCAARLRELNAAVAAAADYYRSLRTGLRPPGAWRSLDALIAEAEPQPRRWRWWAAAALAAACSAGLFLTLFRGPDSGDSMRATELLAQSAAAEPPGHGGITVRSRGGLLVRPAVLDSDSGADAEGSRLASLFQRAGYSWQEPLSARSFSAWRDRLQARRDTVSRLSDGTRGSYRVRTETSAGALRAASLTLRMDDLHATAARFEFPGEGSVEMEEAAGSPGTPAPRPAARAAEPAEVAAGPEDTLRVLVALHSIGADVGDPVEVGDDAQHRAVLVRASGLKPAREQQIAQVLEPLPRVRVDFAPAGTAEGTPHRTPAERASGTLPAAVRARFEQKFGSAAALQTATDELLETLRRTACPCACGGGVGRQVPAPGRGGAFARRRGRPAWVARAPRLGARSRTGADPHALAAPAAAGRGRCARPRQLGSVAVQCAGTVRRGPRSRSAAEPPARRQLRGGRRRAAAALAARRARAPEPDHPRAARRRPVDPPMRSGLLLLLLAGAGSAAPPDGVANCRIFGRIQASSGEALPGARVEIQSESDGTRWRAEADESGAYSVAGLRAGLYKLRARLDGFRTASRLGLSVAGGESVQFDFALEIVALHESITVVSSRDDSDPASGESLLLTRQSPGAGLPANGRDFRATFDLLPGVVVTPASLSDAGQFASGGQRPNSNAFRVDDVSVNTGVGSSVLPGSFPGASLPAMTAIGTTENIVTPATTLSVELRTSNFAPEFGERPGAQTLVTTRSGTDRYHGSGFGHLRDNSWSARDWFANSRGRAAPRSETHGWGGVLGGPLLSQGRHFFVSAERSALSDFSYQLTSVPSYASRASASEKLGGILSFFPAPSGAELGGRSGRGPHHYRHTGTAFQHDSAPGPGARLAGQPLRAHRPRALHVDLGSCPGEWPAGLAQRNSRPFRRAPGLVARAALQLLAG